MAAGTVLSVIAGGSPGSLSLFRALEASAIGVQGKRCLWRALRQLRSRPWLGDSVDFTALEAKAVRQWEAIEERRQALVEGTLSAASAQAD